MHREIWTHLRLLLELTHGGAAIVRSSIQVADADRGAVFIWGAFWLVLGYIPMWEMFNEELYVHSSARVYLEKERGDLVSVLNGSLSQSERTSRIPRALSSFVYTRSGKVPALSPMIFEHYRRGGQKYKICDE